MAVGMYDTGAPETNNKNIVAYIKELGFEVDPHAHESQYNYADVAYLIDALGVTPSNIAGGFLASPPEDSKLEYFRRPLTATLDATYTWQAEVLWGGATMLHTDEESVWASGVWKPKDNENFLPELFISNPTPIAELSMTADGTELIFAQVFWRQDGSPDIDIYYSRKGE